MIQYKSLKNECGIYCFKNLINNKCYIGQAVNLRKRLRSHYTAFKAKTNLHLALYKAVDKYGEDNFDLEILEYVDPTLENLKEVLDELEKKYIQEYNSFGPNGYNMTLGGDAGVLGLKMTDEQKEKIRTAAIKQAENTKIRIWCREIARPEYSYGLTYEEAAEKSGVCYSIVKQICLGTYSKPYAKGWTFAKDEITLFNNCASAFRAMAQGTYEDQHQGKFKKGHRPANNVLRPIIELNKNGEIVAEFESVKHLSGILGIPSTTLSGIIHRGTTTEAIQFRIFKYKIGRPKRKFSKESLQNILTNHSTRPVEQYDLEGNLIRYYNSVKEASECTHLDVTTIRKICKGITKNPKCGYIFKYK